MASPFNWNPPEWKTGAVKPNLATDPGSLPYVRGTAPSFNDPEKPLVGGLPKLNGGKNFQNRVDALINNPNLKQNKHFRAARELESSAGAEPGTALKMVSHPGSDFRHVDPGFKPGNLRPAIDSLRKEKDTAKADGEAKKAMGKALPALEELDEMLSTATGIQRLKLVSDHHIVRIITLFGEMNLALAGAGNQTAYTAVRKEYLDLLADIDNRESDPANDVKGEKGYGRSVQWFYVKPIIHDVGGVGSPDGVIKGAVVQAKWNPHISSSGVPIPHL